MTDVELARAIYRFLRDQSARGGLASAPWERLAAQFDAWGDGVQAAVTASQGHLHVGHHGIISLAKKL